MDCFSAFIILFFLPFVGIALWAERQGRDVFLYSKNGSLLVFGKRYTSYFRLKLSRHFRKNLWSKKSISAVTDDGLRERLSRLRNIRLFEMVWFVSGVVALVVAVVINDVYKG